MDKSIEGIKDKRRPPQAGVDRNVEDCLAEMAGQGRPPQAGVDRNSVKLLGVGIGGRRPPQAGVDRNKETQRADERLKAVARRRRAGIETVLTNGATRRM